MSLSSLLRQSNSEALSLSQQTAQYLQKHASTGTSRIPIPILTYPESTETWVMYEKLFLSSLRTGDDKAAFNCLEKLMNRFGATNERIMGLRGLYQEAVAKDDAALERVLQEYDEILAEDSVNTPVAKRRIALLQNLSRTTEAIDALAELLESSPTDIEAWTELSDLYLAQNLFPQAIFCLEEVLLVAPNAWNIHAHLGEVLYLSAMNGNENSEDRILAEATRRFCRSVELCDDYLRGYYGLKLTSDRLLSVIPDDTKSREQVATVDNGELRMFSTAVVRKLNEQATFKLAEITRTSNSSYNVAEIISAKDLLDRSTQNDEDSTGTGVPATDGHEYSDPVEEQDGSWNVVYPDEIGPSDSASRPRTSNQQRPIVEAPRPEEARRPSFRRHISREPARHLPHLRAHRSPPSEPPESVDSHEEWQGYARGPPQHYSRPYAQYTPGYPPLHPYQTYPAPSVIPGGQQQMVPYGFSPYQAPAGGLVPSYFAHGHPGGPSHDMIPHAPNAGYFPYAQQGYQMPMPIPMSPPVVYSAYNGMYAQPPAPPATPATPATPAPPVTTPPPPPSTSDTSKDDEKFARIEKLFLDQKADREAREATIEKAIKDKAAQAEADAKKAEEIATASAAAAKAAKEEVEKEHQDAAKNKAAKAEAEAKKAEEIATASAAAAKAAKEEVEKEYQAAAEAAAEAAQAKAAAAAAAKPPPPPKEKDRPVKFKDAIGRRFNFPFDVCNTWSGMEYLIKEAFLHVADLGPHVADGQYDLLGPKDEIIMPSIWESVIEPGWEITMHMWPIPEPQEGGDALEGGMADIVIVEPGLPPLPLSGKIVDEKKGKKKKDKIPPFMIWTAGKSKKGRGTAKGKKK
ncbi:MAG: hypothetical protein ASARMPRED_007081 [Alectoria sarmentosa]|nr:MAG: hypothetical protein ASARMPRED_007081 [Alectoria sarmentosa]